MSVIKQFDAVRTRFDVQSRGSLVSDKMIFMRDIVLMEHLGTLEAWKLKPDHIPTSLANVVTEALTNEEAITCEQYLDLAHSIGAAYGMSDLFPSHYVSADFDRIEIGNQSWQPKLDVLTERFDALDLVNALDAELVAEFVAQLSSGGDAFALIDAKVLVETNARTTEINVLSIATDAAIALEVSNRDAAIAVETTRAGGGGEWSAH